MPNIIPQISAPRETDLNPVSSAKSRTSIYGNYKRPIGTAIDATLEQGYMPPVILPTQPEYMKVIKGKKQMLDTKIQMY